MASSVTVFTVTSILVFIVGFLCGHFCQKKSKSSTTAAAGETISPGGGSGGLAEIETPHYGGATTEGCCTVRRTM